MTDSESRIAELHVQHGDDAAQSFDADALPERRFDRRVQRAHVHALFARREVDEALLMSRLSPRERNFDLDAVLLRGDVERLDHLAVGKLANVVDGRGSAAASTPPTYMPGRLRTGSRPCRISIDSAVYGSVTAIDLQRCVRAEMAQEPDEDHSVIQNNVNEITQFERSFTSS